ncbi:MAG: SGNH/GDSL hydrolase family protein [Chthoniobacteraceae bacterium]
MKWTHPLALLFLAASVARAEFLPGVKRIVFLGDSITYSGQYVDQFDAYLSVGFPDREFEVIDVGLPSETVSGLSEPGHAGGKFPRPDLHERLDRVLAKTKPDLVVACYGMNDGIYAPFSEERFAAYRAGIEKLRAKVAAAGAQIVHLTPPVFDPEPIKAKTDPSGKDPAVMFAGYDDSVLSHYAEWLLSKREDGWRVVDIHRVMRSILDARRAAEPGFAFAKDGVHPSEAAHWIFSMELVGELSGADRPAAMELMNRLRDPAFAPDFLKLIRQRGRLLADAWLTEAGHKRPGMKAGLPVAEAEARAKELTERIRQQASLLAIAKDAKRL